MKKRASKSSKKQQIGRLSSVQIMGGVIVFAIAAVTFPLWQSMVVAAESMVFTEAAVADAKPIGSYKVAIASDIAYGPDPAETMDVCTPNTTYTAAPGVVLIHGGGWTKGDKSKFDSLCKQLASQGFVAATINYRLATASTNNWPAQLEDVQLAVRWLRENAATYKLDPNRMCSWGESAGAHLALFLNVQKTTEPGDRSSLYSTQSSSVNCTVDDYGPTDLRGNVGGAQANVLTLLGNVSNLSKAEKAASPVFSVDNSTGPVFIVHGDDDTTVLPQQSKELKIALNQAGVSSQITLYDGGHGFSSTTPAQRAQFQADSIQFIIATIGSIQF